MAVSAMVTTAGAAFKTLPASAGTTAIKARTSFAAAAVFESAGFGGAVATRISAAIFAAPAIVVTWSAIVVASTVATRSTVPAAASAAEGALEPGARITAADAGGVAREIFARCARSAWSARFTGEQDRFLFDDRANLGDRKVTGFAGSLGLLSGFVLGICMGFFMSGFGIGFRLLGGAEALNRLLLNLKLFFFVVFLGIFLVIMRMLRFVLFVVFFLVVLFEGFATGCGFSRGKGFLIFGFDEFRGQRGDLVVVQIDFTAHGRFRFFRLPGSRQHQWSFFRFRFVRLIRGGNGLFFRGRSAIAYAFFGEQPTRQSAGKAARTADGGAGLFGRDTCWRDVHRAVGQKIFGVRLRFVVNLRLNALRRSRRSPGLSAIFGERFTGKQDRFFGRIVRSGRRTLPGAFAAWLTTTRFKAARGTATVTAAVPAVLVSAIVAAFGFKISGLEAPIVAAVIATRFTGRRCVFGRRKVAPRSSVLLRRSVARTIVRTATAAATTTATAPAPSSTASTITTTVATAITTAVAASVGAAGVLSASTTAVIATAEILAAAIAAATGWIVLRGVVVRRKILRSRSVGLRLLFVRGITAFAVKTIEMFSGERIKGRS